MAAQKHLIKKYANRKLYDTQTSRYITLDGISQLVREGRDIQVVDRDTGRDLTPLILSQIVVGEEKRNEEEDGDSTLHDRGQALFDYVRRTLSGPAALVSSRVERGRSELEELVDLAVEQALTRLSIPTRRDLDALSARLDELEARLPAHGRGTPSNARQRARAR
ncbi:MAG TPA: polyhydroxyalkanoate synthesis regulator DNA-binding domain-containing protein [Candidatus Dormibacteraeota bacterium]|nr:polyhydroxyalkanoate synthesis regulator DNA-binding domain-containing protein [Candidatus Dormibacteraeota bacterium]